jgi:hypothetical protein
VLALVGAMVLRRPAAVAVREPEEALR